VDETREHGIQFSMHQKILRKPLSLRKAIPLHWAARKLVNVSLRAEERPRRMEMADDLFVKRVLKVLR
jgi:hypothetical protein